MRNLTFTGRRAALARAIARWEASAGPWEVREAPFGLWRIRAAHTRRVERVERLDDTAGGRP